MRKVFKMIEMGFGLILVVMIVGYGIVTLKSYLSAQRSYTERQEKLLEGEEMNKLSDLNGQTFVGTEVISLARKYGDQYSISIDGTAVAVSEIKDEVNTAGLYECTLLELDSETGTMVPTVKASHAKGIDFCLVEVPTQPNAPDYSPLIQIVGGASTSNGMTQEQIDSLAEYCKKLQEQNALLDQNNTFKHESGTVYNGSKEATEFVPTDVILWREDGQAYYVSLNGTIVTGSGTIATNFDGITIKLEFDANNVITKCTIVNESSEPINYRVFRVTVTD